MTTAGPRPGRRRRGNGRASLTAHSCPSLAAGVAFEPTAEGSGWLATVQGVPTARLSRAVVDLLTAMDGRTPVSALQTRFAPGETDEEVLRLVARFRDNGLLDGGASRPPGRVAYRPPFTVQFATLRAPALFARLDRLVVPVPGRGVLVAVVAVLAAGFIAAVLLAGELGAVLARPVPLAGFTLAVVALGLATLLHEAAHGLTLTRLGGRPRRAGFMLLYLTPAFFVDVTDGWRLPDRRHRVAIALAGPAVHATVAAVAMVVALALPSSVARETLLLLAISCTVVVLVNLIPFVRFDGYLALMSALDEPNLRGRTVRDGAAFLARLLFGAPRQPRALERWWSVPFGLCCLGAPVVLVLFAVVRAAQLLAGGGPAASLLVLALEVVVVAVGVALLARALLRVRRSGVSRSRLAGVTAALALGIGAAGLLIPVPTAATLGFSVDDGRVVLVHGGRDTGIDLPDGAPVVLSTRGILANEYRGVGTMRTRPATKTEVPIEALFPVRMPGASVAATVVAEAEMTGERSALPAAGQARVDLGTTPLWQAIWATVASPLAALTSEKERG
ncbi:MULTISPECIES: daptide biosynthesis intramembrane metalloprotease [unclassified Microbacterium]|uniref:daptide biosynthesis intramembrane metalloprotease n=1 Tax=unclassified Microbacterium TaxID=2609290 RepID=UPI0025EEB703|nr:MULTISPECIES: daptide biosynthesis intramembrane metalloprotease [unclassified Microbacterium]